MQKKKSVKTLTYVALAAFVAMAASFVWSLLPNRLLFQEVASLPGFRELVTNRQVSGVNPLLTGIQGAPGSSAPAELDFDDFCAALFDDPSSPTVGSDKGQVRLVTFLDYRCPYCRILTKIISDVQSDGDVQVIYKEWPILGESSVLAARAALAAAKQGQYIEFHKRLMDTGFVPTRSYVEALAGELNLNQSQLLEDMNAPDITAAIQRSAVLASEFGFVGTPALIVGRTVVQGAITRPQLEALIEDEAALGTGGVC